MERLRGVQIWHRPTYRPSLKASMAVLESNNGFLEAGIGSDQKRGLTLIKVKGCLTGG